MLSVYEYSDYRHLIRDRVAYLRERSPSFSYRAFNRHAGLKSSGHLKLIMDGKRNIGANVIHCLCHGFKLSDREARYFECLVHFTQARNHAEKDRFYRELITLYPIRHAKSLEVKAYEAFTHWYYVAVLEMVRLKRFRNDPAWIGQQLRPQVPVVAIRRCLRDLQCLDLLRVADDGQLERTDTMLRTPDGIANVAISTFQEQMSHLACAAIKHDAVDMKEFSTLTIAVGREDLLKIKQRVQDFRRHLHAEIEASADPKVAVAQINLQSFLLVEPGGNR